MKDWLIERMSVALRVPKNGLDPDEPFTRYGLQSIDAVILAMEIEDELGFVVPPTLLWEYNTVHQCVDYLVKAEAEKAA